MKLFRCFSVKPSVLLLLIAASLADVSKAQDITVKFVSGCGSAYISQSKPFIQFERIMLYSLESNGVVSDIVEIINAGSSTEAIVSKKGDVTDDTILRLITGNQPLEITIVASFNDEYPLRMENNRDYSSVAVKKFSQDQLNKFFDMPDYGSNLWKNKMYFIKKVILTSTRNGTPIQRTIYENNDCKSKDGYIVNHGIYRLKSDAGAQTMYGEVRTGQKFPDFS